MAQKLSPLFFLILLVVLTLTLAEPNPRGKVQGDKVEQSTQVDAKEGQQKNPKVISLFNVVQFDNEGCRSQSTISGGTGGTRRNGTCFTSTECSSKGGTASGSCASGFGVCCVFLVSRSGSTITQNCTYIRNPDYPSQYGETNSVQYTIAKCGNNVCQLRLDFESFTIQGTGNTLETEISNGAVESVGGTCIDTFQINVGTSENIPTICGKNTGQHMYVDVGLQGSDTASLNFAFTGTASGRLWEIKVTQIPCYGACYKGYAAPQGCLQYHTGLTGRFTTFNFIPTNDNHLRNQEYSVCIRQEEGFCCIEYTPCTDANSFSIDNGQATNSTTSGVDTSCMLDYIGIEGANGATCNQGSNNVPTKTRFCGTIFNAQAMNTANSVVCDCTQPFRIDVYTDNKNDNNKTSTEAATDTITKPSRGVCLTWRQIPCT